MTWLYRLAPGGLLVLALAVFWIVSGGAGSALAPTKLQAAAKGAELDKAAAIVAQIGKARGDVLEAVQTSSDRIARDNENTARVVIAKIEQVRVDLREVHADLSRQVDELRKQVPKQPPRRRAKTSAAPKSITNPAWPYTITYATGRGRPRA